ncbi:MAG TPA: hypothetical protein DCF68_20580 [Cyanothece sp. UBA12306]|nr:hypothetical protein [Cyanothece sp. UBA12306]
MLEQLSDLELKLRDLSHSEETREIIREFAKKLKKSERQAIFSANGSLIIEPIIYENMLERGLYQKSEDPFSLLQGDIIRTDSAYLGGERLTGMNFAVASSTCDLVTNRREYANLLRIQPIFVETDEKGNTKKPKDSVDNAKVLSLLGNLLTFKPKERMYLPRLKDDSRFEDKDKKVIANALIFDGIVQIRLEDLLLATRQASLTLLGWRIFGSLVRISMVKTGDSEVNMRSGLWESLS